MTKKNPLVFLDICIDGDPSERMVFELFSDVVSKTAENFRALCTGERGIGPKSGRPLHYKGSFFHRIIRGSFAQAGDFVKRDGTGGESIYDGKFPEETPRIKHQERGLLSMPITDRDSRGSQFIITFKANLHLDRKYVVFGKLVEGTEVLKKIERAGDEEGNPSVTVKITNCGEFNEGKRASKMEINQDASNDVNNRMHRKKGKHKKSSRGRKRRRKYSSSESDSSSDTETESSESDSDSDSFDSSSSDISSSSDDRRSKRKRSLRRDKWRRGKRKSKRREKKHRRRDKRLKRQLKRLSDTDAGSDGKSGSSSDDNDNNIQLSNQKPGNPCQINAWSRSPPLGVAEKDASPHLEKDGAADMLEQEEGEFRKENGVKRINGIETSKSDTSADRQSDAVVDHSGKSRSCSISPKRTISRSSSPRKSLSRSPSEGSRRSVSRSPSVGSSPLQSSSISASKSDSSKSADRSDSQSPIRGRKGGSISLAKSGSRRSISGSPVRSTSETSPSSSPPRRSLRRSVSRSSDRVLSRKGGISRSPVRMPSRNYRRGYSRTPSPPPRRRVRSPRGRERSLSRSITPDGSSKRIRRGRGFSQQYSYARRYRTRSPNRSPGRSYRYGGRFDRDSYRRYSDRSPRRYRSSPRGRSPRYRSRRSRTRSPSVSASPVRYRPRRYSPSPFRSRSPIETSRYRASSRTVRRRPPSRTRSPSRSRSSPDSPSPRHRSKGRSMSSSGSPPRKKGLVSYGDGSPDSGRRSLLRHAITRDGRPDLK